MIEHTLAWLCVVTMIVMPLIGTLIIIVDMIKFFSSTVRRCKDCKWYKLTCSGPDCYNSYTRKWWKFGRSK